MDAANWGATADGSAWLSPEFKGESFFCETRPDGELLFWREIRPDESRFFRYWKLLDDDKGVIRAFGSHDEDGVWVHVWDQPGSLEGVRL